MIEARFATIGGLTAPVLTYESLDEAEAAEKGGALRETNNNLYYRGVAPAVRDIVVNLVEADTKIERESKVVGKTKAGKDIVQWEPEARYCARVMAKQGWEDLTKFQTQVDEACRAYKDGEGEDAKTAPLAVDVKGREYTPRGPVKLAAKYKIAAAKSITLGTVDKVNANMLSKIGKSFTATNDQTKTFTGVYPNKSADGKEEEVPFTVSDSDAETYGRLIKEYQDWKASQELAELTS